MNVTTKPDPKLCPLCLQPNNCGQEHSPKATPCWCESQHIPKDILKLIPDIQRGKACICQSCAKK